MKTHIRLYKNSCEDLGYEKPHEDKLWYGEECRVPNNEKNAARMITLHSVITRAVIERYKGNRREETRLFRKKKRKWRKREILQIETYRRQNEARKFSQEVKILCNDYGSGLAFCKDKDGILVADSECMLKIWREYFSKLLVQEITNENLTEELILNNGGNCHPSDQDEV